MDIHQDQLPNINIFSDSQAALLAVSQNPKTRSSQLKIFQIQQLITSIQQRFSTSVHLYWCPAHVNIQGNEQVDQLAKSAAEDTSKDIRFPQSISPITTQIRKTYSIIKNKTPIIRNNITLQCQPSHIFKHLTKLEKGFSSLLYQLRSGHCALNQFLYRINKIESPNCPTCKTPESVFHFLLICRKYKHERTILQQNIRKNVKVDPKSLRNLLDNPKSFRFLAQFLQSTGRFNNTFNYLTHQP